MKVHGTVTTPIARCRQEIAYNSARRLVGAAQATGYTLVGACPGKTMLVCKQHQNALPIDADFCLIVQVN